MKKMSIAFVAAMSLVSFAGCKKKGSGDAMGKIVEMKDKMCKCTDKGCADKVNDEYTKWGQEQAKNASGKEAEKPNEEDAKKMTDAMKEYGDCMAKAMGAGGGGGGSAAGGGGDDHKMDGDKKDDKAGGGDKKDDKAAGGGGGGDLPAECNDYKAAVEKLASCDKLPQATRDQMKQAFDTASTAWKDVGSLPAEAKKALSDGCKTAADAVTKAAEACK
jgi:hypothetical protein